MKQRPILFSTPMVQAIRKGTKTQTRRTADPQPTKGLHTFISPSTVLDGSDRTTWIYSDKESSNCIEVKCKYGQPGDVLWVKETYFKGENYILYKANGCEPVDGKWKPSIFMPKDAARIWLKITNVRLEQLQDISEEDASKEGVGFDKQFACSDTYHGFKNYLTNEYNLGTSTESFETLWQSINGGNWNTDWSLNPFVWVIEFEQIEKPD